MTPDELEAHILALPGIESEPSHGFRMYYHGPGRQLPFATIAPDDNEHDAFCFGRPGVYRFNLGLGAVAYRALLGAMPSVSHDGVVQTNADFHALDEILPHPHYGHMGWICIYNPSAATFTSVLEPLLRAAHARAAA